MLFRSTGLATTIVAALAWLGEVAGLARLTALTMLTIFSVINLALWQIKRRDPHPAGVTTLPAWLPPLGFLVSGGIVVIEAARWLLT